MMVRINETDEEGRMIEELREIGKAPNCAIIVSFFIKERNKNIVISISSTSFF
jgi:hypothetical protein